MKIGELTKRYDVSSRRIRHYEKIGLLTSSREPFSNYRMYDDSVCDRIEIIKLLRELGFSLAEIKLVLDSPGDIKTREIMNKKVVSLQNEIDAYTNRVQILKAITNIVSLQGLEKVNLGTVIRECSYIHSKNERMIPVSKDKLLIQVGVDLIPICNNLIKAVPLLREKLLAELGITIPTIRIRDEIELDELTLSISIDGKQICVRSYSSCDVEKTSDDVISLLESCLKDNLETLLV